jgi:hypothetical protein
MAERMTVVVVPQNDDGDGLTVGDAMRQVLDIFDLLTTSNDDSESPIVWRLIKASTNTPLTVTGEAQSADPNVNADVIGKSQKADFAINYASLRKGIVPLAWQTGERRKKAKSLIDRSRKAIAKTIIVVDPAADKIEITNNDADAMERTLDAQPAPQAVKVKDQIGSVEGYLIEVGTHYKQPAIKVNDRKTGIDVWCVIPDEFRSLIAGEANFDDVWSGRRVVVHGRITYESPGVISRVFANDVQRIEPKPIDLDAIKDKSFTGGLSVAEYIEKLREGSLGG